MVLAPSAVSVSAAICGSRTLILATALCILRMRRVLRSPTSFLNRFANISIWIRPGDSEDDKPDTPVSKTEPVAGKRGIMEEKRRDLNRPAGDAATIYDEVFK